MLRCQSALSVDARPAGRVRRLTFVQWTVLLPLKALPGAKSRLMTDLDPGDPASEAHVALVRAIRQDTLNAAHLTPSVGRVLVIADRAEADGHDPNAHVIIQSEPGLNSALREGAAHAAARWPEDGIAALVGDLPALRPEELREALAAAGEHPRAFVPDATGSGTTLLTAIPHTELLPEFGAGSAARHARTATPLAGGPSLRQDVDTAADLTAAAEIGLGPATLTALAAGLGRV